MVCVWEERENELVATGPHPLPSPIGWEKGEQLADGCKPVDSVLLTRSVIAKSGVGALLCHRIPYTSSGIFWLIVFLRR